jgi:hypothetical protein
MLTRQERSSLAAVVIALALAVVSPIALADEAKHNYAEGDNPNLDEAALQGTKKASNPADQATAATPHWDKLSAMVRNLVLEFYPKAKIKESKNQLHAEYKSRMYDITSTNKTELGPDWGGLVFDMELKQGPYAGVDAVPKKFNEYSYYHVELFAPYSKQYDRHLLTKIYYPFDVPQDFLKRFKKLVEDFEQYM